MSELVPPHKEIIIHRSYQPDNQTQNIDALRFITEQKTEQALQAVRGQIQQEIHPSHFQYCVERHIQDCEFGDSIEERIEVFKREADELYEAVVLDRSSQPDREHVAEELGDTLFTLFSLMNVYGLSFDDCTNHVLDKNLKRFNSDIARILREQGVPEEELYQTAKSRI